MYPATSGRRFFLTAVTLLISSEAAAAATYGGNILFELEDPIDPSAIKAIYRYVVEDLSYPFQDLNFTFNNFPKLPLFIDATTNLTKVKEGLENVKTLLTIGRKSHHVLQLSSSKIGIRLARQFLYMNYVPIFDFPITLQAEIIEKVYTHIRKKDTNWNANTLFVLNATNVNHEKPWEDLEVANIMIKEVSGNLRFSYYNNNADEITNKIRDGNVNIIVLLVGSEATKLIMEAAQGKSLFKWRYRWIIFLPVTSTLNIQKLSYHHSSSNITVIQFANPDVNSTLPVNTSLSCVFYDASRIMAELLNNIFYSTRGSSRINGLTGTFSINYNNVNITPYNSAVRREDFLMHVYLGLGDSATYNGSIFGNADGSNITVDMPDPTKKTFSKDEILNNLRENTFRIITVIEEPFSQWTKNRSTDNTNGQVEGFIIDIVKALMTRIDVPYKIDVLRSGIYGAPNAKGEWSGMILEVMNGRYEMAGAAFKTSNQRKQVVDFTESFLQFRGGILYKQKKTTGILAMFQFLQPFEHVVWGMLLGSAVLVAIILAILQCLSPNEINYNFFETIYFSISSLFQGVTSTPPDRPSSRMVVGFWWFFTLIVVITYIANYAAFRTQLRTQGTITSLQDLLKQNTYKYGTVINSGFDTVFAQSTVDYMKQLDKMMRQEFPNGLVNSSTTALRYVEEGAYAFFWDDLILNYFAYQNCLTVTGKFDRYEYAFVLPKNAIYKPLLDEKMNELKKDGTIDKIMNRYPIIKGGRENPICAYEGILGEVRKYFPKDALFTLSSDNTLALEETLGIFAIMVCCCVLSLILAVIEFTCRICCEKCRNRRNGRQSVRGAQRVGESRA